MRVRSALSAVFAVLMAVSSASPAGAATTVTPGGYRLTWHFSKPEVELIYPGVLGGTAYPAATSIDVYLSDSFAYYRNEVWLVSPIVQYIGVPFKRTDIEAKNTGFTFSTNGLRIDGVTPGQELVFAIRTNIGTGLGQDAPYDPSHPDQRRVPPLPRTGTNSYPSAYADYYANNANYVFYTGAPFRNLDALACAECGYHDKAQYLAGGQFARTGVATFIGYEDYFRTPMVQDRDFNDAGILVIDAGRRPGPTATNPNPPDAGCTLTIGYWKNHTGALEPLLPQLLGLPDGPDAIQGASIEVATTAQAVTLLGYSGDAKNGINKLYGQLLAAQLNVVNPASLADPSAVTATIVDASAFLVSHDAASWTTLSAADKTQVLAWVSKLDSYNNGLIGPGHCP